jgi:hypothetical protein
MFAIEIKFFGCESAVAGFFVENTRIADQFVPRRDGVHVDFDNPWIRGDFDILQSMIGGWQVAFEHDGHLKLFTSAFDGSEEFKIIFESFGGGHEQVEFAFARFDT